MTADALDPAGVSFGATDRTLFASTDGGLHWAPIAAGLRRIQSVGVSVIGSWDVVGDAREAARRCSRSPLPSEAYG